LLNERVGIVGGGAIATGLAACLAKGPGTVVAVRSDSSAARARAAIARNCEKLGAGHDPAHILVTTEFDQLRDATFLIESVAEDEAVKLSVLNLLGRLGRRDAVLATTTSSLSIERLGHAMGVGERFVGLHVFNPVPKMALVELTFTPSVILNVRDRATAFCLALGKTPVVTPDRPGFVVNSLLFPYLFGAIRLMEETGLTPEAVDACMTMGAGHPMGPLGLLDYIGLDVSVAIGENLGLPIPISLKRLVESGELGRKTGSGFHGPRRG
jgi:3-hydroxybutyryl-CoA dehydrogenase